jgi:hypothetical protein
MFAIAGLEPPHAPGWSERLRAGLSPDTLMSTLRRIHAATLRHNVASWASPWLCVILGAYFSLQLVQPGGLVL